MKNYNVSIRWRDTSDQVSGRMSVVRADSVGDAMGIALDRIQKLHARGEIEIIAVDIREDNVVIRS